MPLVRRIGLAEEHWFGFNDVEGKDYRQRSV